MASSSTDDITVQDSMDQLSQMLAVSQGLTQELERQSRLLDGIRTPAKASASTPAPKENPFRQIQQAMDRLQTRLEALERLQSELSQPQPVPASPPTSELELLRDRLQHKQIKYGRKFIRQQLLLCHAQLINIKGVLRSIDVGQYFTEQIEALVGRAKVQLVTDNI